MLWTSQTVFTHTPNPRTTLSHSTASLLFVSYWGCSKQFLVSISHIFLLLIHYIAPNVSHFSQTFSNSVNRNLSVEYYQAPVNYILILLFGSSNQSFCKRKKSEPLICAFDGSGNIHFSPITFTSHEWKLEFLHISSASGHFLFDIWTRQL